MAQTQHEIDAVLGSAVESIVASVRANCTPPSDAVLLGGDHLVLAVADWIENPPEWVNAGWADQARALYASRHPAD